MKTKKKNSNYKIKFETEKNKKKLRKKWKGGEKKILPPFPLAKHCYKCGNDLSYSPITMTWTVRFLPRV